MKAAPISPVWAILADGELDQIAYSPRDRDRELRDLRAMGFSAKAKRYASEGEVYSRLESGRAL